jgi:death-on-curing protein
VNEPIWLDVRDALTLHQRSLAVHGGGVGVRDVGLLESAIARPRQLQAYADAPDLVELAAAYAIGLIRNHPFADGNKRIGFLLCVLFLELNGYEFTATEESATTMVLALAARTIEEREFALWVRTNSQKL